MSSTVDDYSRSFLPSELDTGSWDAVQPWVEALLAREIDSVEELRAWLRDVCSFHAAISHDRARRYIALTCNPADSPAHRPYLEMVEKFLPAAKPWLHKLNEFYVAAPFREQLGPEYEVLDRNVEVEVALFREENIELQTKASVLTQQYQKISGAMTVQFRGEERTMPQMGKFLEATDRETRYDARSEERRVGKEWRSRWSRSR